MKISLVSLNQVWQNKEKNLQKITKIIKYASQNKVELIAFPEMTLTGFSNDVSLLSEDEKDSFSIKSFSNLAKNYNIAIIFGMISSHGNKGLNRSLMIDKNGKIIGNYTKIHPFSFSNEDKFFISGEDLCIIDFHEFKIGLTICYDLRFPELYSALGKNCHIIFNIANWPKKRIDHWQTLLKSRAIENQIFIAGVNRKGVDGNNLQYQESSYCFDPSGKKINKKLSFSQKIFEINFEDIENYKKNFNSVKDRKNILYKNFL
jgi:predicted amidohydrolase